ncbi:hypothetical protein P3T76_013067 [Phytophthora citrophthora]|uniref:BZIP transcription factor n=1 Tax=Phytophthora citrophthora TaxID=4793 RepID=A0AAD9LCD6_9STRA|nr:hypothetical protein P3T76_013067 [Phytophthora citrophthora]
MSSFLTPPNNQFLSEQVISRVVQRKKRYSDISSNVIQESKRVRSKIRRTPDVVETTNLEELLKLSQILERERRRVNQARYRKKQNDRILTLEKETEKLKQYLEKLTERKRVAISGFQPSARIWDVALEYVRLFGNPSCSTKKFISSTMSSDVTFNSEHGIESILWSWRCLSQWFQDLKMELESVTKMNPETLVASTTTSFTMTKDTLSRVFPNLANNSALASKLLGQRVAMKGRTLLQWDDAADQVTRVNSGSDLLSPMLHLLTSLENVSVVFDRALVTFDFQVRSTYKA